MVPTKATAAAVSSATWMKVRRRTASSASRRLRASALASPRRRVVRSHVPRAMNGTQAQRIVVVTSTLVQLALSKLPNSQKTTYCRTSGVARNCRSDWIDWKKNGTAIHASTRISGVAPRRRAIE